MKKRIWIGLATALFVMSAGAYVYMHFGTVALGKSSSQKDQYEADVSRAVPDKVSQNPVRIPIFIYHSVRPNDSSLPKSAKVFDTTPDILELELKYLHDNGYTTISLDELVSYTHAGKLPEGQKPVVLTFDDGLENQHMYAYPLLKKYGVKATFFVYPNPIEHNDSRFMSWAQVREIAGTPGMDIGDHTMTHPLLSKATPDELTREIVTSKKILEEKIGKPVTHFASPFGYTSQSLVALLKESGYTTGRTTTKGTEHTSNDLLSLSGYMPHNTLYDFTWSLEH